MRLRVVSAWRLPLIVLAVSLALTAATVGLVARLYAGRADARFANAVESATDRIVARLEVYESILRSGAGLFASLGGDANAVSLEVFHRFVERMDIRTRYPGVQGIGFTQRVLPADVPELEARMHREGFPAFRVWPEHPRAEYHSILFLEPLDERNRAALGYDMMSEPTRAAAMSEARDTGRPVLSGKVTLVQEITGPKQAGVLVYHPVYQGGVVPDTVSERREKLAGFIYAPFRADDLFRGIFGRETQPRVLFQVFDGPTSAPEALLHDSRGQHSGEPAPSRYSETVTLIVNERPWTIAFQAAPAFYGDPGEKLLVLLALLGTALSLALFAVTRALEKAKQLAESAAAENARLYRSAQTAAQQREDFLSIAAHELRTPLASLQLYVQGMSRAIGRGGEALSRDTVREKLARIGSQTERLSALVSLLLDVSRIRAGRFVLTKSRADLAEIVRDVAVRHRLEAHRAHTPMSVDANQPVEGDWDRARIDQVVTNLVTNAIKYGAGNPVELKVERRGDEAIFEIRDLGLGISQEDLLRIFERFERTPEARNIGGLGLGLWIAREIVDAHGGRITVESRVGEGAVFTVILPAARIERCAPRDLPQDSPPPL